MCKALLLDSKKLKFVDVVKYLGIYIKSSKVFSISFEHVRMASYRCFNGIYSKCKAAASETIGVHLLKAYCLPLVTYGLESLTLSVSSVRLMDGMINNALRKIFNVSDDIVVWHIRKIFGINSIELMYHRALVKFLLKFVRKQLSFAETMLDVVFPRVQPILCVYNISDDASKLAQISAALSAIDSL